MNQYAHKTQYYETDQMGIIHHSNYIRWFEEARVDMLEQLDLGYADMEAAGIIMPVLAVSCEYKKMTYFGETVEIGVRMTSLTGVKFSLEYEVKAQRTGELRCIGESRHCFLNKEGKPLNMKKMYPEIFETLQNHLERNISTTAHNPIS
jgi:acyl-CoA thioester hydrolase